MSTEEKSQDQAAGKSPEQIEDEALLAKLRERFPSPSYELRLLRADPRVGPVVLRNPTSAEYGLYLRTLADDNSKHVAGQNLFVTVCVHPANPAAVLERWPGFLHSRSVQRALAYLAGSTNEAEGKG